MKGKTDNAGKRPETGHAPGSESDGRPGGILPQVAVDSTASLPARTVGVDATGTFCPIPILRLAQACRGLAPGTLVELRASDPGVQADVPAWCEATGNALVSLAREGGLFVAHIRKGG
jgi:TusA-related sulfurtransferase